MAVHLLELIRERNKRQVHSIQHQFNRHEHGNDVLSIDEAGDTQREQNHTQN
jgi:hypothetical protein